ncbi:MAG: CHAP domain-containing protein, partial [Candidatus Saccharibacteria bacterium]|nr:CHAP domain-containing protein [Candidatus Saccharibacteria bacterium]
MTYIEGYAVGGYVCECVSYTGWKAYENYGLYLAWGNAYSWDDYARSAGYRVDNTPAAGTVGQVDGYPYGHVFWVESVNGDGSINVTEYNNAWATYLYTGNMQYGDFGARTIPAGEVGSYNYIHFK